MSFSNQMENDLQQYIFNQVVPSWASVSSFYLALFTDDPGEAGGRTAETVYGGYAPQAVARMASGWTVAGDTINNTALIQFPICTSGSATITYVGICSAATGGTIIESGQLNVPLSVSVNIQPQFNALALAAILD